MCLDLVGGKCQIKTRNNTFVRRFGILMGFMSSDLSEHECLVSPPWAGAYAPLHGGPVLRIGTQRTGRLQHHAGVSIMVAADWSASVTPTGPCQQGTPAAGCVVHSGPSPAASTRCAPLALARLRC